MWATLHCTTHPSWEASRTTNTKLNKTHLYIDTRMHVHVRVWTYTHISKCTHTRIHVYIYIYQRSPKRTSYSPKRYFSLVGQVTVTWHSSDGRAIIIAQMSFINLGQVHIWFRTSADAMLLVQRTSASQISRQPLYIHKYIYTWLTARGRPHFAIPFRYPIIAKANGKVAETP